MTPGDLPADPDALLRELARREQSRRRRERAASSVWQAARWRDPKLRDVAWQLDLARVCDDFAAGVLDGAGPRMVLSAPPRHGKTELVGRALPIRLMLAARRRDEPMPVLYVTSTDDRAEEVSARVRSAVERLAAETGDAYWRPGRKWGTTEWETEGGASWVGIGWRGATGGIGARALIGDDLIGSSEVYRSPTTRDRIWRTWQEDHLSRVMRGGGAAYMETRRGTQDTTARITTEYGDVWAHHVWRCFDVERGYLWPEQYGEAWRASNPHLTDSSPVWRALYQQEPVAEGGTHLDPAWLRATYPEPVEVVAKLADRIVVGVDATFTAKGSSDHVAIVVVACRGAYRDLLRVVRRRMGYVELRATLREIAAEFRPHAIVVELAANGHAVVEELAAEIPGLRGERAASDKVARLTPHLPAYAAGQVRTPAEGAPWVGPWREEHIAFTGQAGEEDDQVDATVWALVAGDLGVRAPVAPRAAAAAAAIRAATGRR